LRKFFHHGRWFFTYVNLEKIERFLEENSDCEDIGKLYRFLRDRILTKDIPDEKFRSERSVTNTLVEKAISFKEIRQSRFSQIIKDALQQREVSAHYSVLKSLVASKDTAIVACETPVWGDVITGHIDAIEIRPTHPQIYVLDYKPTIKEEDDKNFVSQLCLYRTLLSTVASIPKENIGMAVFNDEIEVEYGVQE
jgi:hypothetical protein